MQQSKNIKSPQNPSQHTKNKHKTYQQGGPKDQNGYKNFNLSPAQAQCLKIIENNIITFVEGSAGCFDSETEFLTPNGWKKFPDYKDGDLVGQFDAETNEVSFVVPEAYIKKPQDSFIRLTAQQLDMKLTEEHRVLYYDKEHNYSVISFKELVDKHDNSVNGFKGKIRTTFNYNGPGIDFSEGELRLQVAVMADGRIVKEGKNNYTQMRFSKKRKYDRLLKLCQDYNLPYKDNGSKENSRYLNNTEYEVIVYPKTKDKIFNASYYQCSSNQLKIILDEVKYWDGTELENNSFRYFSKHKENADFIQFAAASQDYRTSVVFDTRENKSCYTVNATQQGVSYRSFEGDRNTKKNSVIEPSKDGFKYCFTVPTSFLVVRRSDNIFISGNSGKSMTSLYYSVKEYLNTPTQKIIVIRTPMEATLHDKVGFLPDNLSCKLQPHFASTKLLLEQLLTPAKVQADIEGPHKRIEFLVPNFALGCTFDNAIIIVDEAQTIPPVIMKLLLERIGTNSKMIVLGDPSQIYSNDKNRQGLTDAISKFFIVDSSFKVEQPKFEDIGYFRFSIDDCMRSDIVKTVLKAYSSPEKSTK